jgi:hypothetical protein
MTDDDGIRAAVRHFASEAPPPADLLDRALAQATRRYRWRLGLGAIGACAALVAGSFAGAVALDRSPSHRGAEPANDPTTSMATADVPPDLTGKALADALGLQAFVNCGWIIQVEKGLSYCMNGDWPELVQAEVMYQLRGYERTDTVEQLAQMHLQLRTLGTSGMSVDEQRDFMTRFHDLENQLFEEQGRHPYTGFEPSTETTDTTSTEPTTTG